MLVVAVVARGAPGRAGGGGRGRRGLRQRLRSASTRLGLELCQGQECREAGAVGGDGRRSVVLARSRGRRGRRLLATLTLLPPVIPLGSGRQSELGLWNLQQNQSNESRVSDWIGQEHG